jgi:hypothetical protein
MPRPQPLPNLATLGAGQPVFLTLGRDEQRSFVLRVPEGGLYRVETLGRLRSRGSLGTAFLPSLDQAEANGTGQNMLIQHYLRAGDYRLTVGSVDSAGRLGVVARPAPMQQSATLAARHHRARRAARRQRHRLPHRDHRSPATTGWTCPAWAAKSLRGWRMPKAGRCCRSARWTGWCRACAPATTGWSCCPPMSNPALWPGLTLQRARLPRWKATARTRSPSTPPPRHQWREPTDRDDPRIPDQWDFTLAGPATVTMGNTDNGMTANLAAAGRRHPHAHRRSGRWHVLHRHPARRTLPGGSPRARPQRPAGLPPRPCAPRNCNRKRHATSRCPPASPSPSRRTAWSASPPSAPPPCAPRCATPKAASWRATKASRMIGTSPPPACCPPAATRWTSPPSPPSMRDISARWQQRQSMAIPTNPPRTPTDGAGGGSRCRPRRRNLRTPRTNPTCRSPPFHHPAPLSARAARSRAPWKPAAARRWNMAACIA